MGLFQNLTTTLFLMKDGGDCNEAVTRNARVGYEQKHDASTNEMRSHNAHARKQPTLRCTAKKTYDATTRDNGRSTKIVYDIPAHDNSRKTKPLIHTYV